MFYVLFFFSCKVSNQAKGSPWGALTYTKLGQFDASLDDIICEMMKHYACFIVTYNDQFHCVKGHSVKLSFCLF